MSRECALKARLLARIELDGAPRLAGKRGKRVRAQRNSPLRVANAEEYRILTWSPQTQSLDSLE